jgi:stage V sporulation protein B
MGLINSVTLTSLLQGIGYTETAATELLGVLEQKAQTLVSIPMVAGTALSASLVPSISESIMKKEKALISLKTSLAVRVGLLISLPSAIGSACFRNRLWDLCFWATARDTN